MTKDQFDSEKEAIKEIGRKINYLQTLKIDIRRKMILIETLSEELTSLEDESEELIKEIENLKKQFQNQFEPQ